MFENDLDALNELFLISVVFLQTSYWMFMPLLVLLQRDLIPLLGEDLSELRKTVWNWANLTKGRAKSRSNWFLESIKLLKSSTDWKVEPFTDILGYKVVKVLDTRLLRLSVSQVLDRSATVKCKETLERTYLLYRRSLFLR